MLALRCVWHQVNNYRVLCSWLHMANAGQTGGGAAGNPYVNMSSDIYMGGSVPDPESGEMDLARSRPGHLTLPSIPLPISTHVHYYHPLDPTHIHGNLYIKVTVVDLSGLASTQRKNIQ